MDIKIDSMKTQVVCSVILAFMTFSSFNENDKNSLKNVLPLFQVQDPTNDVLNILEVKCNSCHKIENKGSIFTLENMNEKAKSINRQVFIKEKMPKGDDITLTDEEKKILKDWILIQTNK